MDVTDRSWRVRYKGDEQGPIPELQFQEKLRAGKIPLKAEIKSNLMDEWAPLLQVVATDKSFRRPSTIPGPDGSGGAGS